MSEQHACCEGLEVKGKALGRIEAVRGSLSPCWG